MGRGDSSPATEAIAVHRTFIGRFAIAAMAIAAAASLAGCASSPAPFSFEEKVWFDKAVGHDLIPVRPALPYPPEFGPPPHAPHYYQD
jgi:hypothetical protein